MNGGIFMKGSSLGYLLKTGFKNVYMNRLMSLASIGVLVACLMLIGGAVLLLSLIHISEPTRRS